jgi:RNA polymerase sigma factor (sigma-70 family)
MDSDTAIELARKTERVANSVLRNSPDAKEISQETVSVILANERSIDDPLAYGGTVAYRAAVRLRRLREREDLVASDELPEPPERQRDFVQEIVNRLFVADLLKSLPPQQAEALELRHLMDMPVAEVAAQLGVTINTAKTHLRLGRLNALRWFRGER